MARSPCTFACPAGLKAHGYVSLIRAGEHEQAFDLVLKETPLVGTLGRACYAPCEAQCSRGNLEGPLPIRRLKRFAADTHYRTHGPAAEAPAPNGKQVAVVGSGPAGLTAAWKLARRGYAVRIFEAAAEPGGMLRLAIPSWRLPAEVVERDIENVTALGVEIVTDTRIEDLGALKRAGYDAVLVATGAPLSVGLGVPGEDHGGVVSGLDFLEAAKAGAPAELHGKRVVVVGGGNVAIDAARTARRLAAREADEDEDAQVVMDAARTARRLGAREVVVAYRRGRDEMPAQPEEVDHAEREGVQFMFQVAPVEVLGDERGRVTGVRCVEMVLGWPDASGRPRPEPVPGSEFEIACEAVIPAIGLTPAEMKGGPRLATAADGTIAADPGTVQTSVPYIFAAGDVVLGASDIARAVGQGRRAAFMIDRWLQGSELDAASFDQELPVIDKGEVLGRQRYDRVEPRAAGAELSPTPVDFEELEPPLTGEEALAGAQRCLDCGPCSECAQCVAACPLDAIDLDQHEREQEFEVGAIVLATGYKPFDARRIPAYGYGKYPNVYTSLEVERLLNASGPTQGEVVLRDGSRPAAVGIVHCVGSRDARYNTYCSKVCCMASLKLAHLIKERSGADVYNFYIDMRTAGKGYEEFYNRLLEEGMHLIRGRVAEVTDWTTSPEEEGRARDPRRGHARRRRAADPGGYGGARGRNGGAGRRRRRPAAVQHRLRQRGLLHRAPCEAGSRLHVHRRRLPGGGLSGPEGHPGQRRASGGGRRRGPGPDRPRLGRARTEHGVRRPGRLLGVPDLRAPVSLLRDCARRRAEGRGRQRGAVQGLRDLRRRLPIGRRPAAPVHRRAGPVRDSGGARLCLTPPPRPPSSPGSWPSSAAGARTRPPIWRASLGCSTRLTCASCD